MASRAGSFAPASRSTRASPARSVSARARSHASASARSPAPDRDRAPWTPRGARAARRFRAGAQRADDARVGITRGRSALRRAAAERRPSVDAPGDDADARAAAVADAREETPSDYSHVDPAYLFGTIEPSLSYLNDFERAEVRAATELAFAAHDGQRRKSGEPFVVHPVAVAGILADMRMDHETLIAGLLHDTVEDTDRVTFESIEARFGPAVRRIVEGETKVSKVSSSVSKRGGGGGGAEPAEATETTPSSNDAVPAASKSAVQADDLREMFLAMTQEVRVIIVKLADRLHNMRTLGALKPEKRVKIARETLLVFAPLAKLLGMYRVKNELERLAFAHGAPELHAATSRRHDELIARQEPVVMRAAEELSVACERDEFLRASCARVEVTARAKEFYGMYRKAGGAETLAGFGASPEDAAAALERVNEVAQLRVVLRLDDDKEGWSDGGANGVSSRVCYHVLGMVHAMWPPVPGRMKDYIATPKLNGYRALHTVVLPIGSEQGAPDPEGRGRVAEHEVFPLELQIRTESMDRRAELGIAADPEVKAAWRTTARRTGRRLLRARRRERGEGEGEGEEGRPPEDSFDFDADSDSDSDSEEDSEEDSVLIRSGHARQVAWLSNIREWQEEFLGVLTAEEFVDTITGDLLGRRVFVFTPSGGVMNLPHGSTAVDYAFYVDRGLDATEARVNGVAVPFDTPLRNADVVEIAVGVSNLELDAGGAGEASAAAVANAARKHAIATQTRFLEMARTRSARAKIKKFLAEARAELGPGATTDAAPTDDRSDHSGVLGISALDAMPSSEHDIIDPDDRSASAAAMETRLAATRVVETRRGANADGARGGVAVSPSALRKFSAATVWLRCEDRDGLLREISATITEIGGCSIVGYAGESLGDGEFVMTYTFVLDAKGELARALERCGDDDDAAKRAATRSVLEFDARLAALYRELGRNEAVKDARLFCKRGVVDVDAALE